MNKKIRQIALFMIVSGLFSCKVYYIPLDSFKEQFKGIDSTTLKTVYTVIPSRDTISYLANSIEYIKCVDEKDNPVKLKNSPSIEIRFTLNRDRKRIQVFYFDYVYLQDSMVIGGQSRFHFTKRSFPIKDIIKIEVQDELKSFRYVSSAKKY